MTQLSLSLSFSVKSFEVFDFSFQQRLPLSPLLIANWQISNREKIWLKMFYEYRV